MMLLCKIHCPLMCFCKPSPDNSSSTVYAEEESVIVKSEAKIVLKSCIKNLDSCIVSINEGAKKRVQWKDILGEELSEITEFESSETGYINNEDGSSHCLCVIL
ncbi:hypothetical protein ACP275_14G051600 [Erythranthe tilingii]